MGTERLYVYVIISELNTVWRGNMAVVLQVLTSICVYLSRLMCGYDFKHAKKSTFFDVLREHISMFYHFLSHFFHAFASSILYKYIE